MFKTYIAKHYSLLGLFSIEQNPHYVPIYLFIMSSQLDNEQYGLECLSLYKYIMESELPAKV